MNPKSPSIPLPKCPRHQRFADLVLTGRKLVDAYLAAGFKCGRPAAKTNAQKLRKKPDVRAYIEAVQAKAADETTLSVNEILQFCARVVRTPITKLDPRKPDHPDADLIKSYTLNDGPETSSMRLEKHDPYKAIATHLDLTGAGAEANANNSFAAAIAAIGALQHTLPDDKM